MILRTGEHVTGRVVGCGSHPYLGEIGGSFTPLYVFVRGESFEDAWEWLLCHPLVVRDCTADLSTGDYGTEAEPHGFEWNDDGVPIDPDWLSMRPLGKGTEMYPGPLIVTPRENA